MAEEAAAARNIECSSAMARGRSGEVLVRLAEQHGADVLVVGNKGMERRILGSVPNTVTHKADLLGPCGQDDLGRRLRSYRRAATVGRPNPSTRGTVRCSSSSSRTCPSSAACRRRSSAGSRSRSTSSTSSSGKELARQGEFGQEFFVIVDGTAEVVRDDARIAELGPGDFFGEMALLEEERRTATVRAASPMRVLVMTRQNFRSLDHPRRSPLRGQRCDQRAPRTAGRRDIRAAERHRGRNEAGHGHCLRKRLPPTLHFSCSAVGARPSPYSRRKDDRNRTGWH